MMKEHITQSKHQSRTFNRNKSASKQVPIADILQAQKSRVSSISIAEYKDMRQIDTNNAKRSDKLKSSSQISNKTKQLLHLVKTKKREGSTSLMDIAEMLKAQQKIKLCNFLLSGTFAISLIDNIGSNVLYRINTASLPSDRKGYYEGMTKNIKASNYWINWPAYCTGDLPSMGAALLMGFKHGISISPHKDIDIEKSIAEVSSYVGGIKDPSSPKHTPFIINDNGWKVTTCSNHNNSGSNDRKRPIKFSWLTRVVATGKYKGKVNGNKDYVERGQKGGFNDTNRKRLREVWLGLDNKDLQIHQWLKTHYEIDADNYFQGKNVTVLWIRKSGERGGAHYENDTSLKVLKNYIGNHLGLFILAGDEKDNRAEQISKENNEVLNLTEFWKNSDISSWGGDSRTGQFRLYDYIKKKSGSLQHIGSMSGGLEALALIGHKVSFKAKQGDNGVSRMEQYASNPAIEYDRIDFTNRRGHDYKGYEKLTAKYYVFFSSGVIKNKPDVNSLLYLFERQYIEDKEYKVYNGGLNGDNAKTAILASKKLAKRAKYTDKSNRVIDGQYWFYNEDTERAKQKYEKNKMWKEKRRKK